MSDRFAGVVLFLPVPIVRIVGLVWLVLAITYFAGRA